MRRLAMKDRARTRFWILLVSVVVGLMVGCAGFSGSPDRNSRSDVFQGPMSQVQMELLFASHVEAILGPPGAIQTRVDGINVYLISDPANDRMRIVAPVARMNQANPRLAQVLLQANFHSTLDARYAVSDGLVYAAFLHPLSSLTPDLIESALSQVLSLAKTFGSTFSSGQFQFGVPLAEEP